MEVEPQWQDAVIGGIVGGVFSLEVSRLGGFSDWFGE